MRRLDYEQAQSGRSLPIHAMAHSGYPQSGLVLLRCGLARRHDHNLGLPTITMPESPIRKAPPGTDTPIRPRPLTMHGCIMGAYMHLGLPTTGGRGAQLSDWVYPPALSPSRSQWHPENIVLLQGLRLEPELLLLGELVPLGRELGDRHLHAPLGREELLQRGYAVLRLRRLHAVLRLVVLGHATSFVGGPTPNG